MIANSPAFRSGKKPLGACAMKYAKAMSPARMNATGRVNNPSTMSTPPTSSIMPLMPESDMGATPVEGETGKLKYFDIPCSIMGVEDEVEQSIGRPCRQFDAMHGLTCYT